jgi:hypothetical protein
MSKHVKVVHLEVCSVPCSKKSRFKTLDAKKTNDVCVPIVAPLEEEEEVVPFSQPQTIIARSSKKKLPDSLVSLGNSDAWNKVLEHVRSSRHTLLLSGPVGCGKTMGVNLLLKHHDFIPHFIDAVEADDNSMLVKWIKRGREIRSSCSKQCCVVLDDIEGFTEFAKDEISKLTKQNGNFSPVVIICNNNREEGLRMFSHLKCVQMKTPSEHVLFDFFVKMVVWKQPTPGECEKMRRGFSERAVNSERDLLSRGDIRRVLSALVSKATFGTPISHNLDTSPPPTSSFQIIRRIFQHLKPFAFTVDNHFERKDLPLLVHNHTRFCNNRDSVADFLDTVSLSVSTLDFEIGKWCICLSSRSTVLEKSCYLDPLPSRLHCSRLDLDDPLVRMGCTSQGASSSGRLP